MITKLIVCDSIGSTQDAAREAALDGAPEGTAFLALNQEKGRGRLGRTWISPAGKNLALSVILRPRCNPEKAGLLGLMSAVCVCNTLELKGIAACQLKWPNDVLVHGKKISGILPEALLHGDSIDFIIMGFGVNLNTRLEDYPDDLKETATSYRIETGIDIDPVEFGKNLLNAFEDLYAEIQLKGYDLIPKLWLDKWAHRGLQARVNGHTGTAESIASDGALLLRQGSRLIRITAGEMFIG